MTFPKIKRVQLSGAEALMQNNICNILDTISGEEIIDGNLLTQISLKTGLINKVNHGLNKKLTGWIIIRNRANSIIWDSQDSNNTPGATLDLNCSVDTIIDLWVF